MDQLPLRGRINNSATSSYVQIPLRDDEGERKRREEEPSGGEKDGLNTKASVNICLEPQHISRPDSKICEILASFTNVASIKANENNHIISKRVIFDV